jgi:DNA repair protein RecN (Recombination protein N)
MLIELEIKDFALIEHIQIAFSQGLNVLTGETGAGKSIIIDALNCLLGGKAGPSTIRANKEKAILEGTFSLSPMIIAWLKTNELYDEEISTLAISREISKTGSKIRINGTLANATIISDLRQQLLTVHAQHEARTLMSQQAQIELLDGLADDIYQKLLQKIKTLYVRVNDLETKVNELSLSEAELNKKLDFANFQLNELTEANLNDANEDTVISNQCQVLANVVELANLADTAQVCLSGESDEIPAAITLVQQAALALRQASELDDKLTPVVETINNCLDALEEGQRSIRRYKESLDTDPESLSQLQARLAELAQIKRKYGPTLNEAIELKTKLEDEIEKLANSQGSLDSLNSELAETRLSLTKVAEDLSSKRKALSKKLGKIIEAELIELGMANCRFEISVSPTNIGPNGMDKIEFLIAPNPGQPLLPLSKIASGGELSRVMLAVKSIFAQADQVATVVFDEIDTGLSGKILQIMAQKLAKLAKSHQILCITHQPIVASVANGHIKINKKQSANKTEITVMALDKQERIKELAHMASGNDKQEAMLFAQSLFEANSPIK